jgi:PTS system cellobiose-specific IIC component
MLTQGDSLAQGYVFTTEFFHTADVHVLAMAAAVLVFSANRRLRSVTWFMLPFLAFNISLPYFFCLPVVLNPAILLPFLIAPLANTLVAWAAVSWGIVPVFQFATAGTVPVVLSGILGTGSLMGGVLHLVVFILDVFIYAPFVIVTNRINAAGDGKEDAP